MKIFISWSGDQSKAIALALNGWLQSVIQSADPYMSDRGNVAGDRWGDVVNKELHESNFGILCMTPDNLDARWLLFEAGALGKAIGSSHVVPLLHGVRPSDIEAPLTQFMMKTTTKAGVRDVIDSINKAMQSPLPDTVLTQTFEAMWPSLESQLEAVAAPKLTPKASIRSERDLLEELLALVRAQSFDSVEQAHRRHLARPDMTTGEEMSVLKHAESIMARTVSPELFSVRTRGNFLSVRTAIQPPKATMNELVDFASTYGLKVGFDIVSSPAEIESYERFLA